MEIQEQTFIFRNSPINEPLFIYFNCPQRPSLNQDTGNKVSRKSVICGSQNIILGGKVCRNLSSPAQPSSKPVGQCQYLSFDSHQLPPKLTKLPISNQTILQTGSVIRGDLRRTGAGHAVVVSVGRYCFLSQGCVIRPPCKTYKG